MDTHRERRANDHQRRSLAAARLVEILRCCHEELCASLELTRLQRHITAHGCIDCAVRPRQLSGSTASPGLREAM